MKIGFIGFGNMATAMAIGWINCKVLEPSDIIAYDPDTVRFQEKVERLHIRAAKDNLDVINQSDAIILAVKPDMLAKVITKDLAAAIDGQMVISIAVNQYFDAIEALVPKTNHISILPNLPIEIGKGIVVAEKKNSLSEDQKAQFERLFEPVAYLVVLEAAKFGIAGTIASCGPAFVALFSEALADAGVEYGLMRPMAYELAARMMEGSAGLLFDKRLLPSALKDMVCSPAGTTIQGVNTLRKNDFQGTVIEAVEAIQSFSAKKSR